MEFEKTYLREQTFFSDLLDSKSMMERWCFFGMICAAQASLSQPYSLHAIM